MCHTYFNKKKVQEKLKAYSHGQFFFYFFKITHDKNKWRENYVSIKQKHYKFSVIQYCIILYYIILDINKLIIRDTFEIHFI